MAMYVLGQLGQSKAIVWFLILTLLFGGVFLGVKAYEWNEKFESTTFGSGGLPFGRVLRRADQGHAQLFFSIYFAMTGLHALHMIIGVGISAYPHRAGQQRQVLGVLLYTPVDVGWALLALRRCHLDFPVPASLP